MRSGMIDACLACGTRDTINEPVFKQRRRSIATAYVPCQKTKRPHQGTLWVKNRCTRCGWKYEVDATGK
jgi:hypothetical protein